RCQEGRGLIADRTRQPLGAVICSADFDPRIWIVFHYFFLPLFFRDFPDPNFFDANFRYPGFPEDRFASVAILRCPFGLCRVCSDVPACAPCSSRKRNAPATGAASTSSTLTGSPNRYVAD